MDGGPWKARERGTTMDTTLENTSTMFQNGDRVELHPATDRWMMGDRFGVVVGTKRPRRGPIGFLAIKVKLDKSGQTLAFHPANLSHVG